MTAAGPEPATLGERAVALALSLGFDVAGIAGAEPGADTRFLRDWLAHGYDGEMAYLGRRLAEREDPRQVLEGAQSVISVGFVYDPGERPEPDGPAFRVARYAGGDDYHDVLLDRLRAFETGLEALAGRPVRSRSYVDTGPVQERAMAARAGLGWIGKNTLLIHPRLGSYLFLGVVLTDLPLAAGTPEADHCGSCRACLDICPTDAFPEPYVLDATRCIAYTTIELRGSIPEPLRAGQGDWGFGCDLCQEVCPWNLRKRREIPPDPHGIRERFEPRPEWRAPTLAWVLGLDEEAWRAATRKHAMRRTRYRGLMRNALVAAGNSRDAGLVPAVRRHAEGGDALLAEHARWALDRIGGS